MRKHLDHKDLINTIRLELRHPSEKETIWIIVEGVNDVKLFSKLIDGENVEIKEPYGGVRALCKVIETLHTESDRIIAIRDADFSRLGVNYTQLDVLFLTDYHDAEMMTLMSDITFQSIISEHLNSYLPQYQSLRRDLLAKLKFLGGLRLFNEKNNASINFEGLSIKSIFDSDTVEIDKMKCLDYLKKRSKSLNVDFSIDEIETLIQNIEHNPELCSGHDFVKLLAFFVTINSNSGLSHKTIGSSFRLAYSKSEFKKTHLYQDLREWEKESSYRLFKDN